MMPSKQQIEQAKVGRELDALVGRYVTGVEPRRSFYASFDGGESGWYFDDDAREVHAQIKRHAIEYPDGWTAGSQCCTSETYPVYSTTGDGMLLVLERMVELRWLVSAGMNHHLMVGGSSPLPGCSFLSVERNVHKRAIAPTLPEAVCRAALLALASQKEVTV